MTEKHFDIPPRYFVLFKGDSSDFDGNQELFVEIKTDKDLTGCKAHFRFLDFAIDFDEIPEDKKLLLVFPKDRTARFPLGAMDASLVLEDSLGRMRTVSNRIHIVVTNSISEAYCDLSPQAISVVLTGDDFLKDAYVSQDGKTLTITKKDGSTVEFQGGGTEDYNELSNKPQINGHQLTGNKSAENLGLQSELPVADYDPSIFEIRVSSALSADTASHATNAEVAGYADVAGSSTHTDYAEMAFNAEFAGTASIASYAYMDGDGNDIQETYARKDETYTQQEVDDKITRFVAHYLTSRTLVDGQYRYVPFATNAELTYAKQHHTEETPYFFYAGEGFTPTKNDYCVVLADESVDGKTTRYSYVGEWPTGQFQYQYTINETAFSQEQWAAINSLTSVDEDGNLCFDDIPIVNSSGELLETDPVFTAWKNALQIVLGGNASISSSYYKQIAIGAHATANGQNAIAIGSSEPGGNTNGPRAMAQNAIAIGAGANATAQNAIQIFAGTNGKSGTIQVGNKTVAFLSDIPISQADIDDYRYYKGHWAIGTVYKTGDIVRAVRTVEGVETVAYFKSLKDNNIGQNPFTSTTYWTQTTDDEGLDKLTLFVKAAISNLTGEDITVSSTDSTKISAELANKRDIGDFFTQWGFATEASGNWAIRFDSRWPEEGGLVAELYDGERKVAEHSVSGYDVLEVRFEYGDDDYVIASRDKIILSKDLPKPEYRRINISDTSPSLTGITDGSYIDIADTLSSRKSLSLGYESSDFETRICVRVHSIEPLSNLFITKSGCRFVAAGSDTLYGDSIRCDRLGLSVGWHTITIRRFIASSAVTVMIVEVK